jgi:hypothetical protein
MAIRRSNSDPFSIVTDVPLLAVALIQCGRSPKIMNTQYLDQLAHQLRIDKTPACRRAINRILAEMKTRCEKGEYNSPMAGESAFRKFVEDERTCQKTKAAVDLG